MPFRVRTVGTWPPGTCKAMLLRRSRAIPATGVAAQKTHEFRRLPGLPIASRNARAV
jgi:hypothetical protein